MKTLLPSPHALLIALPLAAACGAPELDADVDDFAIADLEAASYGAGRDVVYTMTNDAAGNQVLAFRKGGGGALSRTGAYATRGRGTGAGLGNQGGVILSGGGGWLYAVNAGSNDISVFRAYQNGLSLVERVPSQGTQPISLTLRDRVLYVLNAGADGNIAGFYVTSGGWLRPIPGSVRPLSGPATGPAQISFSPDRRRLVVTEKATNRIDVYPVDNSGRAGAPDVQPSAGQTPFGFAFDRQGRLFVSEAFGGAVDQSALSSYRLSSAGRLQAITPSARTTETAACWAVLSKDGRHAYTTNTGSGTVSGYRISASGALTLLDTDGVTGQAGAGSRPIDAAVSSDGAELYTLNSGTNEIAAFRIRANGALTPAGRATGLPAGANGLAAR